MEKLISIITVSYNSESTIDRTIKSIVNQMDDDIEYLIIDGASKDNTLNIIKKYSYNNIRIISELDNGIYDAMNKGIRNAKGKWICFINSDDWLANNAINEFKNTIRFNQDADCIYGDVRRIKEINGKIYVKVENANTNLIELKRGMIFSHQSFLANRRVFEKIGNFDTNFNIAADWDFILRAYLAGFKFVYIPNIISNFTIGGACSKSHIIQRHRVRKKNNVIMFYDKYLFREVLYKIKINLLKCVAPKKYYKKELNGFSKVNY